MRSDGGARKSVSRMTGKLGLSNRAVHKLSGRHLPYDHSAMVAVRQWVNLQVTMQHIHPKLMCHFDQVWTTHHTPVQKALIKTGEKCKLKPTAFRMLQGGASCSWSGSGAKPSQGIPRASAGNAVSHKHIDAGGLLKARLLSKLYLHVCTYVHVFAEAAPQVRTYVRTYVA